MARIRTIKPDFPQSESMGRVSRDSRLLFVLLWTVADDSGRLRGNSRMLASLLYPYDDDATTLIDGWLSELEVEGCIVRYMIDGSTYLQICKWLNHQKIDRPSVSKLPEFVEGSRILASPREPSPLEVEVEVEVEVDREGECEGKGKPVGASKPRPVSRGTRLPADWEPSAEDTAFLLYQRPDLTVETVAEEFRDYWVAQPGQRGVKTDWPATWRNWVRRQARANGHNGSKHLKPTMGDAIRRSDELTRDWVPSEYRT